MNHTAYKEAYCEVLYIINNMHKENRNKISKKFIDFLENKKSSEYIVHNICMQNPNSLKRETKIILSILYRNYFCTEEEKVEKEMADQKALNELYSYDNLFKQKRKANKENSIQEEVAIVPVSRFRKMINSIKEKIKKILLFYKK